LDATAFIFRDRKGDRSKERSAEDNVFAANRDRDLSLGRNPANEGAEAA